MNEQKSIEHFFRNVLVCLGIYGWRLRWVESSSEGYCWKGRKIIDIGEQALNKKELVLHEISHIRTCRFCNNKHTQDFWWEFERLMNKFLPSIPMSKSAILHRQYMGSGFYRLCYGRKKYKGETKCMIQ